MPCGFFLSFIYLLSFFPSPNLSRRRLDVYHTLTHGVALVMVALCNRADHNIFMLFLLSSSSSSFRRLISAVGDWMFTILWHMMWP